MIITIASWGIISIFLFGIGLSISGFISKFLHYRIKRMDSVIMVGIVGASVYAELFSIFYKVGRTAILILLPICILGVLTFRKEIHNTISTWIKQIKARRRLLMVCLFIMSVFFVFLGAYLAAQTPGGYDEYNYHIPSVRWIEEYGLVKGLGNLHTRFGYNSSFLCLQALFSFSWIFSASMHSMNGYIWVVMIVSSIIGLWWFEERKFGLSDLLSIVFILILLSFVEMQTVSGPNTDFLPFCLSAYIFVHWCKLIENKEESVEAYGLLSLLGLFSMTTKLSTSVLFLFAIIPIWHCIKEKKYIVIGKFIFLGLIIVVPFLIRNVLTTGYLLYPVASIDLFNFDWKIPKSVVISESKIIQLFARSNGIDYRYEYYTRPFFNWFKIWIKTLNDGYNVLAIVNTILSLVVLCVTAWILIRRKKVNEHMFVMFMAAVGFVFLLFTAPSVRFGRWWFFVLPLTLFYFLIRDKTEYILSTSLSIIKQVALICVLIIFCLGNIITLALKYGKAYLITPSDYTLNGSNGQYREISGIKFYFYSPNHAGFNSLNGYDGFPGTECLSTLARIELRGDSLSDGFRPKSEYRNVAYDFQGNILGSSAIDALGLSRYYDIAYMSEYDDVEYRDLLYTKKISIVPEEYEVIDDALKSNINKSIIDEQNLYMITGWAYILNVDNNTASGRINSGTRLICIQCDNDYYVADTVKMNDVQNAENLNRNDVGLIVLTKEDIAGKPCIIDMDQKKIYR